MTLHEAIERLLRQTGRSMTAREIADELNKNKWYAKGDKSEIKVSQVIARVDDHHNLFEIDRSFSPLHINLLGKQTIFSVKPVAKIMVEKNVRKTPMSINLNNRKTSFDPISNADTIILILGTMPGDKSIELSEYYGHPRNKFWRIISTITYNELPQTYSKKKELLLNSKIGIWDVAHKANRKGSLDIAIKDEEPNDLDTFIAKHKNLKLIGFNGSKSEALYDKYFERKSDLIYISLPSTSPANTSINFDNICKVWRQVLKK